MNKTTYILQVNLPDGAVKGDEYSKENNSDRYRNVRLSNDKSPVIEHNSYFTWQVESNPTFFLPKQEDKPKEWEIMSFFSGANPDYIFSKGVDGFFRCDKFTSNEDKWRLTDLLNHQSKTYPIHSVKRLSDGEVFTIGDEVGWDLKLLPGNSPNLFNIESFQIFHNRMFCNNGNICIDCIQKVNTKQPTVDKEAQMYQTYLQECECKNTGIIVKDGIPFCRWCRTTFGKGGSMFYKEEHFQSKSTPKEDNIEVTNLFPRAGTNEVVFRLNCHVEKIHKEKYEAVKKAIEDVLNKDNG